EYGDYAEYDDYANERNYDYKEPKKQSVKIIKEVFICDGGEQGFCFEQNNMRSFEFKEFFSCNDNPKACSEIGITESDFQIDVLHSFSGSEEPIKFNFDSTDYRVTEEFLVPGLGDIGCFFAGKHSGQEFERGGFIEAESGMVAFVCNTFEGECSGSLDDKYAEDKVCKVNNYVITAFEGPMSTAATEMGTTLTQQIPLLSDLNNVIGALSTANTFVEIFK
ncbi:MAG: hypothetical protein ACPKPY_06980, partial [Nitrososphaeraceae archaeon]